MRFQIRAEARNVWFEMRAIYLSLVGKMRDRLSASDMIHIRKVMEHVYEKIVLAENTPSGTTATAQNAEKQSQTQLNPEELAALAEAKVELYCNDTVLDPKMDLRTVQNLIWKSKTDLILQYKLSKDK
ncbi:WD repeat-containing protein 48-like [Rhopilema esculentum]|uniref:WD repeat-containing protein 48-like n=1 Tax=Rhopilema esculentum TaxID=499914 RepID=UPI0031D09F7E